MGSEMCIRDRYVGLCLEVGTSELVAIRRDVVDIKELLRHKVTGTCNNVHGMYILSGSRREGFRFKDSDQDYMCWPTDHPVLWDFSQAQFCNTHRDTLILCDSSESPPGFTLLWLPLEEASRHVLSACVLSLIHISEPTRPLYISYAVFCLKK